MPVYWGPQPFTAGPMYIGAISLFLFIMGLVLFRGAIKWWIAGVSLIAVLLSMGYHLLFFTELFFKYAPMYSKFRTVSMILVILQLLVPLLAFLTLDSILKENFEKQKIKRALWIAAAVSGGFALVMTLLPSLAGSFSSPGDERLPEQIAQALSSDRIDLLKSDAFRSLVFVVLAFAAIWTWLSGKLKKNYSLVIIGVLVLIDLWGAGSRYLNSNHFVSKMDFEGQYALRPVDKEILKDKDPNYRVLDVSVNTFNDAHVSYHHKTIGGYSPVKLQRYQDMIDYYITLEMRQISEDLNESKTIGEAQSKLGHYPVLNMLNTKYIIIGGDYPPLVNEHALGNAWFVDSVIVAKDAVEEIDLTGKIDPQSIAVVDRLVSAIPDTTGGDAIVLTSYSPNRLTYKSTAKSDKVAVFSEIYYPAGWSATINGKPAEIFRANYILRGLKIPAGEADIEFVYSPKSIKMGANYSRIASGLLLLLLLGAVTKELLLKK